MIQVKNIHHLYGKHKTLQDISVSIQKHQITAIIGPNGAGKSTLLSVMAGLLEKKSGEILIDNVNIESMKRDEISKTLAILKQTQNLDLRITVSDLVSFGRYPYSKGNLTKDDQAHIDAAINYLHLEPLKEKYIHELSGGERQRAYIAMILAQDTEYLFLDEPLNNLDIKHAVETMNIIKRLVEELNKTVVIVLHDLNMVNSHADNVIALKNGKMVSHGKVKTVMTQKTLKDVYDYEFEIIKHEDRQICLYNT